MAAMAAILDSDRNILAILDLLVNSMSQTKFRVNLFDGSGGVVKNVKS